jgi:hypothetical protein
LIAAGRKAHTLLGLFEEVPWTNGLLSRNSISSISAKLLATEQDVAKRLTLLRLLAEEQAKLASLKDTSGKQKA